MQIWRGTNKASDHKLLGPPIAVASFTPEAQDGPKVPSLAVAVGNCVYMYRLLRPYYKFVVPAAQQVTEEDSTWWVTPADCWPAECACPRVLVAVGANTDVGT